MEFLISFTLEINYYLTLKDSHLIAPLRDFAHLSEKDFFQHTYETGFRFHHLWAFCTHLLKVVSFNAPSIGYIHSHLFLDFLAALYEFRTTFKSTFIGFTFHLNRIYTFTSIGFTHSPQ